MQKRVKRLLMGNEAIAFAALASGVQVVAGYPGTPSSEVIETIAAERADGRAVGVHLEWSVNEKAALELLAGASLAGARCLFTCKQVGLNVASDSLLSLNYIGVKGGLVLYVADDPGPISSQTEQDTRRFAHFAKVPVLDLVTVEQSFDLMEAAFELSEHYQTPVIVRSSTRICHASTFLELPEQLEPSQPEGFKRDPRWVIFPRRTFEAHGEINKRLARIAEDFARAPYLQFNPLEEGGEATANLKKRQGNDALLSPDHDGSSLDDSPSLGILAGGVSASYVREALSMLTTHCAKHALPLPRYRFLQVGTPYPFPHKAALAFVDGLSKVLVFEELDHVLEDELLKLTGQRKLDLEVFGKLTGTTRDRGENSTDDCLERIAAFFAHEHREDDCFALAKQKEPSSLCSPPPCPPLLPARPPVLCAGCPHRGSFVAVKHALKNLKQEALYCGDIGCYTLANAQPIDMVDTCLCMGAGITMAQGLSVVEPDKKLIAFVGDSTFFASGLTGIVNAVYNGHDITVVVLDNSTTAMTGAQPHPGTGVTLMGEQREPISIEAVLRAVGVKHISKANPHSHEESVAAATKALEAPGPSALIFKAPCIVLVKPEIPVVIDSISCTGCKKCILKLGCPALTFDAEMGVATVSNSLCTGCNLCVAICPFNAIDASAPTSNSDDEEGISRA